MLTTCPECRTTFRLTQAQLDARRGLVRCGTCRAVFNAYDTLLPEFETPAAEEGVAGVITTPEAGTPEPVLVPDVDEIPADVALVADELASEPEPEPEPESAISVPDDDDGVVLHLSSQSAPALPQFEPPPAMPFDAARPAPEDADAILLSELPTREHIEPERHIGRRILFGFLSLVLLLALFAQAAYFLREPILAGMPELRPAVQDACLQLGCRIAPAADADAIRVESSSLETDPEQPSRANLRVSFSNRSGLVQQWPHVVLKLTDWKGAPLAQRVFKPAEYLPKNIPSARGMAPGSEQEFRLDLDLGGLSASGYEVLARYP